MFFRARDLVAIGQWYRDHLGVPLVPSTYEELLWQQEAGPTAFAPFPETTEYFGDTNKTWIVNFRVRDLDAMVAQLSGADISVEVDQQRHPNGWFARLNSPVVGARTIAPLQQSRLLLFQNLAVIRESKLGRYPFRFAHIRHATKQDAA